MLPTTHPMRSTNRPSHEGCPAEVDRALAVCLRGGFRRVLLRGDTDFTQTKHLDRWSADERVRFIFGADSTPALHIVADDLPRNAWKTLHRPARYRVKTQPRARPEKVKERIVRERAFKNIRLTGEEVAEFDYCPVACKEAYRMIVVKKYLDATQGQSLLFHDYPFHSLSPTSSSVSMTTSRRLQTYAHVDCSLGLVWRHGTNRPCRNCSVGSTGTPPSTKNTDSGTCNPLSAGTTFS